MRADHSAAVIVEAGTQRLATDAAVPAIAATDIVRNDDALPRRDAFDALPQCLDYACGPVPNDSRKLGLRERAAAAKFHLKEIHAHCAYTQEYFICLRLRGRHRLPLQVFRGAEFSQDNCAHAESPLLV
jgi:hypothetical protein